MVVPNGTNATQRLALPDQLRGFALLGIVFVNMPFLALTNGGIGEATIGSWSDGVIAFLIVALAQGKFYLLFSFLFGYSLTLILKNRTADGLRSYRRRLVGLAVLGILHALLFFIGDILFSYAILGVALLWFVSRSTRTALIGAAIFYGLGLLVLGAVVLASADINNSSGGFISNPVAFDQALLGTFGETVIARAGVLPEAFVFQIVINWMPALSMFLVGLAAGRAGVLATPERFRGLWLRLVAIGAFVGLPFGILSAWLGVVVDDPSGFATVLSVAIGFGTAPLLTAGYVGALALATRWRIARLTEPAGRMSLTGYLGESILLASIFCGWGLGLFGSLTITQTALVTFAVWLSLDLFASLWLKYFAYGPFEWALRSWSNGGWAKMRRPQKNV